MSKPGTVPIWDSNGTNTTAITAGHTTDGYANREVPASNELNTQLMLLGLWASYLNTAHMDGAFTFNATIDCTTGYRGAAGSIALFPVGLSSGATVIAPDFSFTTEKACVINTQLSSDNLNGGAVTHTRGLGSWTLTTGAVTIYYPIEVDTGDTITAWSVGVNVLNSSQNISAQLFYASSSGSTAVGAAAVSSGTGLQLLGKSGLSGAGGNGSYYIEISRSSVGSGADVISTVQFKRTRP